MLLFISTLVVHFLKFKSISLSGLKSIYKLELLCKLKNNNSIAKY